MTKKLNIQLAILMGRFIRKIITLDRNEKACHGVTLSQHHLIDVLYRKDTLTMNELSRELNLAVSTTTRIADILVRDGIITRYPSEQDRRKVCVTLTDKGLEVAEGLKECTERFWTKILTSIPDNKKKEISQNIKLLLNAMDEAEGVCCEKVNSLKNNKLIKIVSN